MEEGSGRLMKQKIVGQIKGKLHKTVVRLAMLYGIETSPLKMKEHKFEVAKMRML